MRQFILATSGPTGNITDAGAITVNNTKGSDFFQIFCGRGRNVVPDSFVVYKKHLTYTKGETNMGYAFSGTITIPAHPVKGVSYGVQITKIGAVFNERNNWVTSVEATTNVGTSEAIAKQLAKQINMSSNTSGIKATVESSTVTVEGMVPGEDYNLSAITDIPEDIKKLVLDSDGDIDETSVNVDHAFSGEYDEKWLKDAIASSIAERGIDSTYVDAMKDTTNFYSNFGIPAIDDDHKLTVFTLSFYNPRFDHNIDEHLTQKLQVVFTDDCGNFIGAFEEILKDKDANNKQEMSYPNYDKTSTYNIGDRVTYGNDAYECNTNIIVAEQFNTAHWTKISI